MIEHIGILIPTLNRHPFLLRQLDWLSRIGIKEVLVVDGSHSAIAEGRLWRTCYQHLPNVGYSERLKYGISKIKSPIVAICADDDYLSPEGLEEAVSFLLENQSYSTAFGQYIGMRYKNDEWDLRLLYGGRRAFSIRAESREERLSLWMKNYMHSFYSPHRLEQLRSVIYALPVQADPGLPTEAEAGNLVELALSISDAWLGTRMVFANRLYMARQATARASIIPSPDWVETFRPAEFRNWVRLYSSRFAKAIGINAEDFEVFWLRGYGYYRDAFVGAQKVRKGKRLSRMRSFIPPTIRSLVRRHILGRSEKSWTSPFEQRENERIYEIIGHISRFPMTLPNDAPGNKKRTAGASS